MEKKTGSADASANATTRLAKQKEIIMKIYEAFEAGNTTSLENYVTADYKEQRPDPAIKTTGIQSLKDSIRLYNSAFPDIKIKINDIFGDGDKLCVFSTVTGTHKGTFLGVEPSNKKINISGIEIIKFTNDKVSEHWAIFDKVGMFTQLGLLPPLPRTGTSPLNDNNNR